MIRKRGFTLMELLIVIGVGAAVLTLTGRFFVAGWTSVSRAIRRVEDNQTVPIVMTAWQRALQDSTTDEWHVGESTFTAGRILIWQDGQHLSIKTADSVRRVLLPSDASCAFRIERPPDMAPMAVMNLAWDAPYHGRTKENRVRFVACGERS